MSASSELVRRSGDLKGELVDFAQGSRFARSFRQALSERFAGAAAVDDEQFINFLDWFVLQHRLPDGQTMVERFVAARPDLSDEEQGDAARLAGRGGGDLRGPAARRRGPGHRQPGG